MTRTKPDPVSTLAQELYYLSVIARLYRRGHSGVLECELERELRMHITEEQRKENSKLLPIAKWATNV